MTTPRRLDAKATFVTVAALLLLGVLGLLSTAASPSSLFVDARLHLDVHKSARGGAAIKVPQKLSVDIEKKLKEAKDKTTAVAKAKANKVTQQLTSSGDGSTLSFPTSAVAGSLVMAGIEQAVKKVFVSNGITFPAQLASCLILLTTMLVSGSAGQSVYELLTPATQLLTKWLPVFFVPGLVMLPLAPSVGSGIEVS
jgi:uncharacterized BrkB/YihY/UPF0761 family membrane protein